MRRPSPGSPGAERIDNRPPTDLFFALALFYVENACL